MRDLFQKESMIAEESRTPKNIIKIPLSEKKDISKREMHARRVSSKSSSAQAAKKKKTLRLILEELQDKQNKEIKH